MASPKSWISTFGLVAVLVVFASITLYASTRSPGTVVVTVAFHAATAPWLRLAVASTELPVATPVNDAPAIRPCVTDPEKVAVRTVLDERPAGASADAIAT